MNKNTKDVRIDDSGDLFTVSFDFTLFLMMMMMMIVV